MKFKNHRVLLVESDEDDLYIFNKRLPKISFYVNDFIVAKSLEEALQLLEKETFDLIMTSVDLIDSPSREYTFTKIREKAKHSAIVLLASLADDKKAFQFVEGGAQDYLVKGEFTEEVIRRTMAYAIERKRIYHELGRLNQKLKEASELKSEFVSMVSHELRSSLACIDGSVKLLLDGSLGSLSDEQKEILQMSSDGVTRLVTIINDLLDMSKIEAGKMDIHLQERSLSEIVEKSAAPFKLSYKEKNLELKISLPNQDVKLQLDGNRITQVFTNLLSNSLKFTDKGSVEIGYKDMGEYVECFVKDTGRGISKENQGKVFGRFEQFGKKKEGKEKGTGLGLSISKKIVELHGGSLTFTSEPGQGSTFSFTIPKQIQIKKAS